MAVDDLERIGRSFIPDGGRTVPVARRSARSVLLGVVALCAGIVAVAVGTMVLQQASAFLRIGIALVGAALCWTGVSRLCRSFIGPQFDLGLWLSVIWLGLLAVAAVVADWLPLAEAQDVSKTLRTPTLLRPDLFSQHPLGTDAQGLDILGGVIYGARVSLTVSLGAVAIGMLVGGVVGVVAAYYRGTTDRLIGLVSDSMLAFPPLILLIGLVAIMEPSIPTVAIALGLLIIPTYVRLTRANTIVFAQREFVLAARGLGAKNRSIIFRELVPNVAQSALSYGFVVIGVLIVAEASLSYLGLSLRPPKPTWGNMIAAGQSKFDTDPHLVFVPGVVLFLTVYTLNRVGDKARSIWDPRTSKL